MTGEEIREILEDSIDRLQEHVLETLSSKNKQALENVIDFVNEILYSEISEDDVFLEGKLKD